MRRYAAQHLVAMPNPTKDMASSKPHRLLLSLIVKWQQGGFLARIGIASTVAAVAYISIRSAPGRTASNSSFFIKKGTRGGTNNSGSIPTIVARQVKVQVDNPYNCPAVEKAAPNEQQSSSANSANAKPTNPVIVKGFPATPLIGDGFLKSQGDAEEHDAILFQARSSKFPNGPILSTGSSMLFNTDNDEHRLLGLTASLNYTAIHKDEGWRAMFALPSYRRANRTALAAAKRYSALMRAISVAMRSRLMR